MRRCGCRRFSLAGMTWDLVWHDLPPSRVRQSDTEGKCLHHRLLLRRFLLLVAAWCGASAGGGAQQLPRLEHHDLQARSFLLQGLGGLFRQAGHGENLLCHSHVGCRLHRTAEGCEKLVRDIPKAIETQQAHAQGLLRQLHETAVADSRVTLQVQHLKVHPSEGIMREHSDRFIAQANVTSGLARFLRAVCRIASLLVIAEVPVRIIVQRSSDQELLHVRHVRTAALLRQGFGLQQGRKAILLEAAEAKLRDSFASDVVAVTQIQAPHGVANGSRQTLKVLVVDVGKPGRIQVGKARQLSSGCGQGATGDEVASGQPQRVKRVRKIWARAEGTEPLVRQFPAVGEIHGL
eukprot:scaffold301_cov243-Pinguiococcus_pyrenoidosus.AAC.129